MIGIIAAVSSNGVIGVNGKLPFNYPEDMKHFRKTTANSIVIMGRKTFESIGRPLPNRRNIVISHALQPTEGIEVISTIEQALAKCQNDARDTWLIGGHFIYEEGMQYADTILLTLTPDHISYTQSVKFPWINPQYFTLTSLKDLSDDSVLKLATFTRCQSK